MIRKTMMTAVMAIAWMGNSVLAQESGNPAPVKRNYFVTTNNVTAPDQLENVPDSVRSTGLVEVQKPKDFISRNFKYYSMCDWYPGMRFMCVPTKEDFVVKTFADARTGNMVSSRVLAKKVLVYDTHSDKAGGLHEQVFFHLEDDPSVSYYFEVPMGTFDDYCYGKGGVPTLAYLGDVDMAQDSLVGKQVRVLERLYYQDSEAVGSGIIPVDIGDEKRGRIMTITKVGVGTRNFPVKIIFQESGKDGFKGQEYFQYVTISHTNCAIRDEDFVRSDLKPHMFKGSFQLLADKMAVSPELQKWKGKEVYTFFNTKMHDAKEQEVEISRLSTFTILDLYKMDDSNMVVLTLKGKKSGNEYTKEVSATNTRVYGKEELLDELFVEGNPETIEGVRAANMALIKKQQVKRGFTEAEVRLALGEPTEVKKLTANTYQWIYQFKDDVNRDFRAVKFSYSTKKVIQEMTR